jgi:hypothetical protein
MALQGAPHTYTLVGYELRLFSESVWEETAIRRQVYLRF